MMFPQQRRGEHSKLGCSLSSVMASQLLVRSVGSPCFGQRSLETGSLSQDAEEGAT